MYGNINYQVHQVFAEIIKFGESKHAAKEAARNSGAKTWHAIGKNIAIYSYATADQYRDIAKDVMQYAKENFRIRDIEKLTSEAVKGYLESKIADGVKYSTFQKYAAAVEKLEVALNAYAQSHNTNNQYSFDIKDVRKEAQETLEKTQVTRAYEDPRALIANIKDETFRTIAAAQYSGGFRVSELNHISEKNFLENNTFQVISGKGGKDREVPLSSETYQTLKDLVAKSESGKFEFDMNAYRNELKQAAERSNQDYTGSHGLRWSFAQEKFNELMKQGAIYEQALQEVSKLLGHERPDITEHYLR